MTSVANKLWSFCHVLRHEGVDYGDYIEQITYLLFLKMADERQVSLPPGCDWESLGSKSGTTLSDHYVDALRTLGRQEGILGGIFAGAQSRFSNPVSLKKLLSLIDEIQWTELGVDVTAEAFEGLLEQAASEGKKGAGQYFTPRILIEAIVRCMKPDPRVTNDFTVADPACGTGGFLVASYEWLIDETKGGTLSRKIAARVADSTYVGQDLVERPRRLALMNLYLHGLSPQISIGDSIYEVPRPSRFDVVLTNPPFGVRGANQAPNRDDFTIETSNKQLNFLQHVMTVLRPNGRAAVVVPDSCLFADEAGGVLRILTEDCNLHTILRLPNGTFSPYSPGTKTNVLFFTKGSPTQTTWIFDARTGVASITKKARPLSSSHLAEFEACYGADPNGSAQRMASDSSSERWRSFDVGEIEALGFNIDRLRWLKAEVDDGGIVDSDELLADTVSRLEAVTGTFVELVAELESNAPSETPDEGDLPDGWGSMPLDGMIGHMIGGLWGKDPEKSPEDWVDVRVIRGTEFRNWDSEFGRSAAVRSVKATHLPQRALECGDLIVEVSGGSPDQPVGRCLLVTTEVLDQFDEPVICSNFCRLIRLRKDLNPAFVQAYLQFLYSAGELDRFQPQTVNIRNLNVPDFVAEVAVPVPSKVEQDQIVGELHEALERVRRAGSEVRGVTALRGSTIETRVLQQSLVARAVRGELAAVDGQGSDHGTGESGVELAKRLLSGKTS